MISSPEFQVALGSAVRRQRLRLAARAVRYALPLAAGIAIVGLVLAFVDPQRFASSSRMTLLLLALGLLAVCLVPMLRRIPAAQAAKALDHDLQLPDSALAWVQLGGTGPWAEALKSESLTRLRSAVPPPQREEKMTIKLAMTLILTLLGAAGIWLPAIPKAVQGPSMPADLTSLDQVLEDWSAFAGENPDRGGKDVKKAAEALELALQDREGDRADLLVRIATVEDQLQSQLSSAQSLEALLPALAEALAASVNPSQAPSSAPSSATEALEKMAARLPTNFPPANAAELEALARQLTDAGHTELAEALRALANATDGRQAQDALNKLSQALSGAEALAGAKRILELAMMQLAAAKEGTGGDTKGALSLLPKLSELGNPGSGAGSDTEFPESTTVRDLESARLLAPVTSANQSTGESRVQVLPSAQGLQESPRTAPSNTAARQGWLSEEAITSEELPVVHRATVRRYFESIRPKTEMP
ncbi:MAG: hypothetical protein WEB60_05920 [Terrimicrobiaceae bacterium]